MKVYLDTCSMQRPLDTLDQVRLRLEAEAVLGILEHVTSGTVDLISSTVLEYEVLRNVSTIRRDHGLEVMRQAKQTVIVDASIQERARKLEERGVALIDALHIALAEQARVDYFCTCDDQILRKAREMPDLKTTVLSPPELIEVLRL